MFHGLDYGVLVFYLLLVGLIGAYKGRKEKNVEDFFLAGRAMPWWVVCFSVLATEISAVTFNGTPEASFRGNYLYLQFAFGSLLGRYAIAYVLLPHFYQQKIDTIYGYLKIRFGAYTHLFSSLFFIITRVMASGVRLYVASLALKVVLGWSLSQALLLIVFIALIYTSFGGLKAVMWTDMLQIVLFFGGALLALFYLLSQIPGGFFGVIETIQHLSETSEGSKFQIFDFSFSFSDPHTFWVSVLFGAFMTFAALGADQDLAQRLLTCRKVKESQRAIILTGYLDFPVVLLFLFLGTCLFVFFQSRLDIHLPENTAQVFPYFIVHFLPIGLKGLLVAGILAAAMSSLDSAMNGLASSLMLDFFRPYVSPYLNSRLGWKFSEKNMLFLSRAGIVLFSVLLVLFALFCEGKNEVLFIAFKVVSFTYGAMLGVFCLGMLTKRGSDKGNVLAMLGSTTLLLSIHFAQTFLKNQGQVETPLLGWSWYIVVGTVSTFVFGAMFKQEKFKQAKPLSLYGSNN